jgi:hypothetical protein
LVAPRRVGKTSILFHLYDNPKENYKVLYFISESVNDENEFYKKLLQHIIDSIERIGKYSQKVKGFAKDFLSRIDKIGKDGITLGGSKVNYYDEVVKFLKSNEFENERLIILIDEFAQTVENIYLDNKEDGRAKAIHFIQSIRTIRQMPELTKRIQFIFAGSIGLENIVANLNSSSSIGDLISVTVPPLSKNEAEKLSLKVLDGSSITFEIGALDYLIEKIEWLIPFYIQLVIDEAYKILLDNNETGITKEIIDKAIKNAIKHRNHFENWFGRLRKAYTGNEFNFVKDVLNLASENETISSNQIYNLAVQYNIENSHRDIINALKHDGYINNDDDPKIYRFNSPILKIWWCKNVAN